MHSHAVQVWCVLMGLPCVALAPSHVRAKLCTSVVCAAGCLLLSSQRATDSAMNAMCCKTICFAWPCQNYTRCPDKGVRHMPEHFPYVQFASLHIHSSLAVAMYVVVWGVCLCLCAYLLFGCFFSAMILCHHTETQKCACHADVAPKSHQLPRAGILVGGETPMCVR